MRRHVGNDSKQLEHYSVWSCNMLLRVWKWRETETVNSPELVSEAFLDGQVCRLLPCCWTHRMKSKTMSVFAAWACGLVVPLKFLKDSAELKLAVLELD